MNESFSSARNVDNIFVRANLSYRLSQLAEISGELNVHNAGLSALEHNVLELLHVPTVLGEDGEGVS